MSKFKSKTKRMFSGTAEYHKLDITRGQLETAIRLFLVDGCDMFSAITLAGAAGEVLHQLVLRAGKRPFVDYTVKVQDWKKLGPTPSRGAVVKHIHKLLFINEMKHHDKDAQDIIQLDAEECALAAILKAVVDHKTLTGDETDAMKALFGWCYKNLESEKIMKDYGELPEAAKAP
jgi:hypothetical protein